MIASVPYQGGATWAVLQYLLGLRRLGHDVLFVEQCERAHLLPSGAALDRSENARYFREVTAAFGLGDRSALLLAGTRETVGLSRGELIARARAAELLVNISGILTDEALIEHVPVRLYLDLDPAFAQLWHAQGIDMRFEAHNRFATVGQAIGSPECPVPTGGTEWIPTPPPVVLEQWPIGNEIEHDAFTTVGHWRGYGSVEHDGVHYGQRAHSLRRFIDLPRRTDVGLLLALAIHPDEKRDLEALSENGWRLVDAASVARTPREYKRFVQGSRGELGIAKSGYALSRCGWFSDRSACYLASGRPVIAQETGFSRFLPTGEGLLSFETMEDILAAIEEVERDYERHARAARALAEQHLDSDRVLTSLLEKLDARP